MFWVLKHISVTDTLYKNSASNQFYSFVLVEFHFSRTGIFFFLIYSVDFLVADGNKSCRKKGEKKTTQTNE